MIDLNGKRALVTGGSRGIGAAIALALAENGADVAFTYQRSAEKAATVAKSIEDAGRRAVVIQADSANPEAITRAASDAITALGGLDILVNNAGMAARKVLVKNVSTMHPLLANCLRLTVGTESENAQMQAALLASL